MDNDGVSDFDFLRPQNIIDKERLFVERINELNTKHQDFFNNRPLDRNGNKDKITNHFYYRQSNNRAFILWVGDVLPQYIKDDITTVFKEILPPDQD